MSMNTTKSISNIIIIFRKRRIESYQVTETSSRSHSNLDDLAYSLVEREPPPPSPPRVRRHDATTSTADLYIPPPPIPKPGRLVPREKKVWNDIWWLVRPDTREAGTTTAGLPRRPLCVTGRWQTHILLFMMPCNYLHQKRKSSNGLRKPKKYAETRHQVQVSRRSNVELLYSFLFVLRFSRRSR